MKHFAKGDTQHIRMGSRIIKIHIRAVVDRYIIVYKWYNREKRRWNYVTAHSKTLSQSIRRTAAEEGKL